MGNFGYICKQCGKAINIDEKCRMFHMRHGKCIGQTEGHYDGYGRVDEDKVFRAWAEDVPNNPNSHEEICKSELDLEDSAIQNCEFTPIKGGSGIIAYHSYCFNNIRAYSPIHLEEETCSDLDPNQSWGKPNKKYM